MALLAVGAVLRFTLLKLIAPYALGAALGAIPGFVVANALLLPLLRTAGYVPTFKSQNAQTIKAVIFAAVLFVGPLAASALGVAIGVIAGIYVAWRLTRRQKRGGNLRYPACHLGFLGYAKLPKRATLRP